MSGGFTAVTSLQWKTLPCLIPCCTRKPEVSDGRSVLQEEAWDAPARASVAVERNAADTDASSAAKGTTGHGDSLSQPELQATAEASQGGAFESKARTSGSGLMQFGAPGVPGGLQVGPAMHQSYTRTSLVHHIVYFALTEDGHRQ
jgi:hypothetical protein